MPSHLTFHAEMLDDNGIPIISRARRSVIEASLGDERRQQNKCWNLEHSALRGAAEALSTTMNRATFLNKWVFRNRYRSIPPILDSLDIPCDAALAILTRRLAEIEEASRMVVQGLALMLGVAELAKTFPAENNPFREPSTLIRFMTDKAQSQYSEVHGIHCSAWETCSPANKFTQLTKLGALTVTHLRKHCEGAKAPTRWISFSDNAAWMLKHIRKRQERGEDISSGRVFIVSSERLDRFDIPWERSDFLVQHYAGGKTYSLSNTNGVKFAWPRHYLVYGWVPKPCILKIYSLDSFLRACEQCGIREGNGMNSTNGAYWHADSNHIGDLFIRHPYSILPDHRKSSTEDDLTTALGDMTLLTQGTSC